MSSQGSLHIDGTIKAFSRLTVFIRGFFFALFALFAFFATPAFFAINLRLHQNLFAWIKSASP